MDKKNWQKPELISLIRCRPQEALLDVCKYYSLSGDPVTYCAGCLSQVAVSECTDCNSYAAS